jgi:hypothetical protein
MGQGYSGRSVTTVRHQRVDVAVQTEPRRARVFDLLNAGRQHRFVIATLTGPLIVSNCTQATAADFLRGTLERLEAEEVKWMPVRLNTHDEILVETTEGEAQEAAWMLRKTMRRGFDWSEGLPIMSEESIAFYYTKHPESTWHP